MGRGGGGVVCLRIRQGLLLIDVEGAEAYKSPRGFLLPRGTKEDM